MPVRLSADYSHVTKWILPPAWLLGWGYFTFRLFTGLEHVTWEGGLQLPPAAKWVFLGVGAFGIWWMARYLVPVHRVDLQGDALAVSHCFRERFVPLTEIRRVRWRDRPNWEHAGRVLIETKAAGAAGRQILFVPRSEAVVEELCARIAEATGSRPEE